MIRYRPSSNCKLCQLVFGLINNSEAYEKFKFSDSGGSMDASLKLKGIDGRAPQGVEPAA
jgi:hypothetical protein